MHTDQRRAILINDDRDRPHGAGDIADERPEYPDHDAEASRADDRYQADREAEA